MVQSTSVTYSLSSEIEQKSVIGPHIAPIFMSGISAIRSMDFATLAGMFFIHIECPLTRIFYAYEIAMMAACFPHISILNKGVLI